MNDYSNDVRRPRLFASCVITRGIKRSVLIDFDRNEYYLIPNSLTDIIERFENNSIKSIYALYDTNSHELLNQFFNFLINKEIIFFPNNPDNFPDIELKTWKTPTKIYNAIIDFDPLSSFNYKKGIEEISRLGCKYLQVRFFDHCSYIQIKNVINEINKSEINFFELYLKYDNSDLFKELISELKFNEKISALYVYGSENNKIVHKMSTTGLFDYYYLKDDISITSCGIVSKDYFTTNIKHFTKSQKVNTCLYGKIGIDKNGNIKNCPSCSTSFGNINNKTLSETIHRKSYKKLTQITKNEIKTCKICEFRNICTDCRAFLEDPNDNLSKPLKCGYDPLTSEWQDWTEVYEKITSLEYYKGKNV